MKYFFVLLTLAFSSAFCQNPKEIGKKVFESFKNKDTSCFQYFITDTAYKKVHHTDFDSWKKAVDSGTTSWKKLAKQFKLGDSIITEAAFGKAFMHKVRNDKQAQWLQMLGVSKSCDSYQLTNDGFNIVKESEDSIKQVFFLVMNAKQKMAVKFTINSFGGKYYLGEIRKGILFLDTKGKFSCTVTCENGKEISRACDAKP